MTQTRQDEPKKHKIYKELLETELTFYNGIVSIIENSKKLYPILSKEERIKLAYFLEPYRKFAENLMLTEKEQDLFQKRMPLTLKKTKLESDLKEKREQEEKIKKTIGGTSEDIMQRNRELESITQEIERISKEIDSVGDEIAKIDKEIEPLIPTEDASLTKKPEILFLSHVERFKKSIPNQGAFTILIGNLLTKLKEQKNPDLNLINFISNDIMRYAITPVQRGPRYELLGKELNNNVLSENTSDLEKIHEHMERINGSIPDPIKRQKEIDALLLLRTIKRYETADLPIDINELKETIINTPDRKEKEKMNKVISILQKPYENKLDETQSKLDEKFGREFKGSQGFNKIDAMLVHLQTTLRKLSFPLSQSNLEILQTIKKELEDFLKENKNSFKNKELLENTVKILQEAIFDLQPPLENALDEIQKQVNESKRKLEKRSRQNKENDKSRRELMHQIVSLTSSFNRAITEEKLESFKETLTFINLALKNEEENKEKIHPEDKIILIKMKEALEKAIPLLEKEGKKELANKAVEESPNQLFKEKEELEKNESTNIDTEKSETIDEQKINREKFEERINKYQQNKNKESIKEKQEKAKKNRDEFLKARKEKASRMSTRSMQNKQEDTNKSLTKQETTPEHSKENLTSTINPKNTVKEKRLAFIKENEERAEKAKEKRAEQEKEQEKRKDKIKIEGEISQERKKIQEAAHKRKESERLEAKRRKIDATSQKVEQERRDKILEEIMEMESSIDSGNKEAIRGHIDELYEKLERLLGIEEKSTKKQKIEFDSEQVLDEEKAHSWFGTEESKPAPENDPILDILKAEEDKAKILDHELFNEENEEHKDNLSAAEQKDNKLSEQMLTEDIFNTENPELQNHVEAEENILPEQTASGDDPMSDILGRYEEEEKKEQEAKKTLNEPSVEHEDVPDPILNMLTEEGKKQEKTEKKMSREQTGKLVAQFEALNKQGIFSHKETHQTNKGNEQEKTSKQKPGL